VVPPPAVLDESSARTGRYRSGDRRLLSTATDSPPFSYADLAVAVVDEIDTPRHHRAVVAVGY
jgi:putative NADH-flavin reductase